MTARTKSALILVATLVVGILLGALGTSVVFNQRLEKIIAIGQPDGFSLTLEEVIQPHDEAQRAQIRAVLRQTGQRMHEQRRAHFEDLIGLFDSTRAALEPLLTDEQKERFDAWIERDRRPWRARRPGERPRFRRRPAPGPPTN